MDWNKAGVPHKGWSCVGVEDIADSSCDGEDIEYERCEMCGQEKIRFVHIMRHPEYPYDSAAYWKGPAALKSGCTFRFHCPA